MTRHEAVRVIAYLNSAFVRDALEEPTVDVFINEVEQWDDAEAALAAATITVRHSSRFPTIAELRATYRSQLLAARASVAAIEGPARQTAVPEWVQVWRWARTSRRPLELRSFPQQDQWGNEQALTMADYETLAQEWRDAQKPTTSLSTIIDELAA